MELNTSVPLYPEKIITALNVQDVNDFFLVINGIVIFFMQAGFAFIEAGSVQTKNVIHTLLINYVDLSFCAIIYWLVGYAFAFGDGNGFIGYDNWCLIGLQDEKWAFWFFQFAFVATSCTIISGSVLERVEFTQFAAFLMLNSGFFYPVVSHWVWHPKGWLSMENNNSGLQIKDAAGSAVVHLTGGISALIAALMVGPRAPKQLAIRERFQPSTVKIPYHNLPFVVLGAFILMFGFLAFNGGSVGSIANGGSIYAKSAINTILSGSAGGLSAILFARFRLGKWSIIKVVMGSIAGAVAICSGCRFVEPWAAFLIGILAGIIYNLWAEIIPRLGIDDPIEAVAVHAGGGSWGLLATALFDSHSGLLLHWSTASAMLLLSHAVGLIVISAWSAGSTALAFMALNKLKIRPAMAYELRGLDYPTCGEVAYPYNANFDGWIRGCDNAGNYRDTRAAQAAVNNEYPNPAYVDVLKMTGDMSNGPSKGIAHYSFSTGRTSAL